MNVREGAVRITDKHGVVIPAREGHLASCGDWCFCYDAAGHVGKGGPCQKCRRKPGAFVPDEAR